MLTRSFVTYETYNREHRSNSDATPYKREADTTYTLKNFYEILIKHNLVTQQQIDAARKYEDSANLVNAKLAQLDASQFNSVRNEFLRDFAGRGITPAKAFLEGRVAAFAEVEKKLLALEPELKQMPSVTRKPIKELQELKARVQRAHKTFEKLLGEYKDITAGTLEEEDVFDRVKYTNFINVTGEKGHEPYNKNISEQSWKYIFQEEYSGMLITNYLANRNWRDANRLCAGLNGGTAGNGWTLPRFYRLVFLAGKKVARVKELGNLNQYFWSSVSKTPRRSPGSCSLRMGTRTTSARPTPELCSVSGLSPAACRT